jgi:hypothetical protein
MGDLGKEVETEVKEPLTITKSNNNLSKPIQEKLSGDDLLLLL